MHVTAHRDVAGAQHENSAVNRGMLGRTAASQLACTRWHVSAHRNVAGAQHNNVAEVGVAARWLALQRHEACCLVVRPHSAAVHLQTPVFLFRNRADAAVRCRPDVCSVYAQLLDSQLHGRTRWAQTPA